MESFDLEIALKFEYNIMATLRLHWPTIRVRTLSGVLAFLVRNVRSVESTLIIMQGISRGCYGTHQHSKWGNSFARSWFYHCSYALLRLYGCARDFLDGKAARKRERESLPFLACEGETRKIYLYPRLSPWLL